MEPRALHAPKIFPSTMMVALADRYLSGYTHVCLTKYGTHVSITAELQNYV